MHCTCVTILLYDGGSHLTNGSLISQDTGKLLKKPWLHEGNTTGKAVSLFGSAMMLAQVVVGLFMGTLIDVFGTPRVVIVAAFIGVSLAGLSALFVRTKRVVGLSIPPP